MKFKFDKGLSLHIDEQIAMWRAWLCIVYFVRQEHLFYVNYVASSAAKKRVMCVILVFKIILSKFLFAKQMML